MKNKRKVVSVTWFCGCCGKDIQETKELAVNDCPDNIYQIYSLPCDTCTEKHFNFGFEEKGFKVVSGKKEMENPEGDIWVDTEEEESEDEEQEETNEETEEDTDLDEYEEDREIDHQNLYE